MRESDDLLGENGRAVAFPDAFPVSQGHALVVPRRHVESYFSLNADEQAAVWELAWAVRQQLEESLRPAGYNLGINDGFAAGQTVEHAHLHVIPRYEGDVEDPRGGVRWVIPERAAYWLR
jgi:diadenosine tetraphosphate (Ap4A) HIT family hydrolase